MREFTGVWIPREIIEDERLNWTQRGLYGEIASFMRCWKTNEELGNRIGISAKRISENIQTLIEFGYIFDAGFENTRFGRLRVLVAKQNMPLRQGGLPASGEGVSPQTAPPLLDNKEITLREQVRGEELSEIPMNKEDRFSSSPRKPRKMSPEIQAVFDLFTWNPARHTWRLREVEREAARVLHETYDLDTLKKRLAISQKHRGTEMFPRVDTPSDFLDKMPKLRDFMLKL